MRVIPDHLKAGKNIQRLVNEQAPISLRDLMAFKPAADQIEIDRRGRSPTFVKRLVSPGISLGALSPEAHETLSIAMNRIGAKSDSGEGRGPGAVQSA